ncbi:hypothetical protein [Yinghuangia sp. YIM S09857]|uniref:hypothetical protein n=1 Tax=Yinghuangia sp. YIM S09857 TaxID=3436929 RepID=UPI003F536481
MPPVRTLRSVALRRMLLTAAAAVLGFAAVVVAFAAWHARLPDPLATHMGADGRADDHTSQTVFLVVTGIVILGTGALNTVIVWWSRAYAWGQRTTAVGSVGFSAFLGFLVIMLLHANLDAEPSSVGFGLGHLAAAAGVFAVAAGLGWLLAGPPADEVVGSGSVPSAKAGYLEAHDGEVLVWTRRVVSPVMVAVTVALPVVGLVVGLVGDWVPSLVMLGAALVTGALAAVRVTANRSGLTVAYGPLPRPRTLVPLARINEAGTRDVRAMRDFGGWGYRVRRGSSGVILRSGEALSVDLATGGTFVVTVGDARTAASVLNTLAARGRRHGDGPGAPGGRPDGGGAR